MSSGRAPALLLLGGSVVVGIVLGFGSALVAPQPRNAVIAITSEMAVTTGTAPIYRGEPGYRSDIDGDGDGIACEPSPA